MHGPRLSGFVFLLAAAVAAAGLTGASGAPTAPAANSASFTDATGDSAGAPDVTTVDVANQDNGLITIRIRTHLQSLDPRMELWVRLDTDRDLRTGGNLGADYLLVSDGGDNSIGLFRHSGAGFALVDSGSLVGAYDSFVQTISINRADLGGTTGFGFYVSSFWTDGCEAPNCPADHAPSNTSTWAYQVISIDTDRDGLTDAVDTCPRAAGGPFDSNRNGCPGPYATIQPQYGARVASGGFTTFLKPSLRGLPRGARVIVRQGARTERLLASRSGTVTSALLSARLPGGSSVSVTITRPGRIGYRARIAILSGVPFMRIVDRQCIPAVGPQRPMPCARVDRGR